MCAASTFEPMVAKSAVGENHLLTAAQYFGVDPVTYAKR
jgi:hypothetical protein